MRGAKLEKWERRLKTVFDRVDDALEEKYGDAFPLRPNRAERGETTSKSHSGLFSVGGKFSLGLGSKHGAGYIVDVRLSTLKRIPAETREAIYEDAQQWLKQELEREFPETDLDLVRDGNVFRITGDFSL